MCNTNCATINSYTLEKIRVLLNNFKALNASQQRTLVFTRTTRLRKITQDLNNFLSILMLLKLYSLQVENDLGVDLFNLWTVHYQNYQY